MDNRQDKKEFKRLKGTKDILPEETALWQFIEHTAQILFEQYGYSQIRTPEIEYLDLFTRSIGSTTDIVQKEMYSFVDRGERMVALRPEATAGVVRAYLENNLAVKGLNKLYYIGAMFRSENPQAGRQRQFHQLGIEAIGSYHPALDAEIIVLINDFLKHIPLSNWHIALNNIGCRADRENFSRQLKNSLEAHNNALCPDCKNRLPRNPLRVLDCKNPECKKIIKSASPRIIDHVCGGCKQHFALTTQLLDHLNIAYAVDPYLVRGLDYYTKTVFEVTAPQLGSQNAICAGGRYDSLVEELGGPPTGACGFAIGAERLLMAASGVITAKIIQNPPDVYMVTLGANSLPAALKIWHNLQQSGIKTYINYEQKSIKSQLRHADKTGAGTVVIIGENELTSGKALIKDMIKKTQEEAPIVSIVEYLNKKLTG